MNNDSFFSGFNSISAKTWEEKINADLKGADYSETLIWESPEGIPVHPFYQSDDQKDVFKIEKTSKTWLICQSITVQNDAVANAQSKEAIKKGAESLHFIITSEKTKIEVLLEGINTKTIQIYFEFQCFSIALYESIISFTSDVKDKIHLSIDPIGHLARTGNWFNSFDKDIEVPEAILKVNTETLCVDVSVYQNAGANILQQLTYALSHANEYLNMLPGKQATRKMYFKVAVGTNYFFEIAKLRALRMLWCILAKAYNIEEECHIIAVPTRRNKTLYDYNTNLLRSTTECMSAVLGGADTVCNVAYDAIYKKDNEFGTRISLNQLLLLKNESYFDKVNNAADGAYYIERLTHQLAEKALGHFKSIEQKGGFLKRLKQGNIQEEIKESALKEQERFNQGEDVLVGTNKYVNETDKMNENIELYPFIKTNRSKTAVEPIMGKRLAELIELKRLSDE